MKKPGEKLMCKSTSFDEFYTLYSQCEQILRPIISKLMDKHIHCPADNEESNIVKWLKENTNSEITYSGLPDVDMNSDEAHRLMLEADMVITNPPFSMKYFKPFFMWLNDVYVDEYHKDYFIWGPMVDYKIIKYIYADREGPNKPYMRPDGSIKKALTYLYCSWKVPHHKIKYKEQKKKPKFYKGVPVFDKSSEVPPTYGDWMYVPITYLNYIYLEDYEIDYKDSGSRVPGKYTRLKIRKKRGNYGKDI